MHSVRRKSALPTVMLLADRFASTVAPASAPNVLGGIGTQTSSHSSTCNAKPGRSLAAKTMSLPNGTVCPSSSTSLPIASRAARN